MQWGGIPPVGVQAQKNRCQADFQVSETMPKFGIRSGDAENRRGIDFFVIAHQHMLLRPIVNDNIRLAAKYGTKIPQIAELACRYVCALRRNVGLILHA